MNSLSFRDQYLSALLYTGGGETWRREVRREVNTSTCISPPATSESQTQKLRMYIGEAAHRCLLGDVL